MLLPGDELRRSDFAFALFALAMNRAGRRRKIVVQPHLGDIQNDSDVRRVWQDMLIGQNNLLARGWRPPVDAAVGVGNFLGRHSEPSPNVEQSVALLQLIGDEIADEVVL